MSRRLRRLAPVFVLVLVLIAAWELYVQLGGVQADVLPPPHAVASALWTERGLLAHNLGVTAEEVVLGLGLATIAGFTLALGVHLSPLLRRAVYPLAVGSQAVPIPVIGVLLVFWWGFGLLPKLVVIALICFFPVLVSTVDALAGVDPEQAKLMRTLDASRWQSLRFAELPAALPAALSGARIALAVGVIGAFIAETTTPTTGAYPGLGRQIISDVNFQVPRAYAGTALLFLSAIACFHALSAVQRRLAPWSVPERGETSDSFS
ncbi:MAG TPA: ABC transporter permease [Solirubrobacteraceae bacterium]|nr:ABC transporter permease [Solirubrobacteraceae bacterium]